MKPIKPVRTAQDHRAALREIKRLWEAKPGSADADRLDVLVTLVEAYEAAQFPMDTPDPIDAIFGLPSDAQLLRVSQPPKN